MFLIQIHSETGADEDFEAESIDEARTIANDELKHGARRAVIVDADTYAVIEDLS